jgi:sulfur relay (sulfurtransferase) complex TusBCD TusD component (DsrE family)
MNKKIFILSLVASLLLGVAFLQSAHAQAVDHSMHGGETPATPAANEDHSMHGDAAPAASEGDGMGGGGGDGMGGGHGKHKGHGKSQNIVVKLDHFDAINWEDPFPGGHNWQPACMALMMADHMLGEKVGEHYTNHVTLFLNLQGVELADTDTASDLSGFTCLMGTLQEGWDNLVGKGVDIAVCPGCAIIGGITEETLRDGAYLTTMDDVSRIFLKADKVIDY